MENKQVYHDQQVLKLLNELQSKATLSFAMSENTSTDELLEMLYKVTKQVAYKDYHGYVDSLLSDEVAKALELLSKCGYFTIKGKYGKRVIGAWN